MKLGIPKALLYFRYGKIWEKALEENFELILSEDSSFCMLDYIQRIPLSEFCLPLKLYLAHVEYLSNFCDHIFLPRVISLEEGYTCPKLIGLPEITNSYFPKIALVTFDISLKEKKRKIIYPKELKKYFKKENGYFWVKEENPNLIETENNIMLISHPYVLEDSFFFQEALRYIREKDVGVISAKSYSSWEFKQQVAKEIFPNLFFCYEKELLGAGVLAAKDDKIKGIIQIVAFNCGPDTLIIDIIRQEAKKNNKPYLLLVIDEHTSHLALETRLETFFDICTIH